MTATAAAKPIPKPSNTSRRYWKAAAQQRLIIQRCTHCGEAVFRPREWCPRCGARALVDEEASGRGTIYSFSIVSQAPMESYAADVPYVVALIELEEGPHMMTNLVDSDTSAVRIGAPVTVTFEQRGADTWIPQFMLSKQEGRDGVAAI